MTDARPVVWIVGSLNVDLVVRVATHPRPGETVLGGDLARFPGGKGANQAAAAALAAGDRAVVRMLARHGRDAEAELVREALHSRGVDLTAVAATDAPTGVALITVDDGGQNAIVVASGANRLLAPPDVDAALAAHPPSLVLSQLETPIGLLTHLAAWCRARRIPLVLNAAPPAPLGAGVMSALDTLIVNEHEAAALGAPFDAAGGAAHRRRAARAAAEALVRRGPRLVVITLGGDGVAWAGAEGGTLTAARVRVVDTTGAGDAFCGAFAAARAIGADPADAVAFGAAAGTLAVTRPGAIPSLPRRSEIDGALRRRAQQRRSGS
jgi:ribokinase